MTARPELVRIKRLGPDGHVAEVILDRPEAMNAVSTAMAQALVDAVTQLNREDDVRAVVITSSHPRAFCVGADLKERHALTDAELFAQRPLARSAYQGILTLEVPVIAAVEGYALGGGCEIALCADLIVAGTSATFALPEVSVGVCPGGGGTQLLTRRVGWSRACRMIFTAQRLSAADAAALGLVDELTPPGAARDRALELAGAIAANSPIAVRAAKSAMREGFDLPLAQALDIEDAAWRVAAGSADRAEGVSAFAQKRPPRWPGRQGPNPPVSHGSPSPGVPRPA